MTSFDEIFAPGIRHWKEYKDWQADKVLIVPAPGSGPVQVDLDKCVVVIEDPELEEGV